VRQTTPPLPEHSPRSSSRGAPHPPPFHLPSTAQSVHAGISRSRMPKRRSRPSLIAYPQADPPAIAPARRHPTPPVSCTPFPIMENSTEAPSAQPHVRKHGAQDQTAKPVSPETSRTHHSPAGVQIHAAPDQHGLPHRCNVPRLASLDRNHAPDTRRQSIFETPEQRGKEGGFPGNIPTSRPPRDMHCDAVIRIARRIRPVRTLRRPEHLAKLPRSRPRPRIDCSTLTLRHLPPPYPGLRQTASVTRSAAFPKCRVRSNRVYPRPMFASRLNLFHQRAPANVSNFHAQSPGNRVHRHMRNAQTPCFDPSGTPNRSFGNASTIFREHNHDLSGTADRTRLMDVPGLFRPSRTP
jgi:hypothetical protein